MTQTDIERLNDTVLNGVEEYAEGYPVKLGVEKPSEFNHRLKEPRLVVVGINEGGHNCVIIDAEQLYHALRELYDNS